MSGEQLSYVSLSKFFPLTTLCSECNLPSCCDISHKSFNTESINDLTDPIGSTTSPNSSEKIRAVVHTPNGYHQRTDNPAICQPNTSNESEQPSHSVNTDLHTNTSQHNIQTDFKFDHRENHIVNVNIRHLKPKLDQIKIMLQGSVIDIFGIYVRHF